MNGLTDKQITALCKVAEEVEADSRGKTARVTLVFEGTQAQAVRRYLRDLDRQDRAEEKEFRANLQKRIKTDPTFAAMWNAASAELKAGVQTTRQA